MRLHDLVATARWCAARGVAMAAAQGLTFDGKAQERERLLGVIEAVERRDSLQRAESHRIHRPLFSAFPRCGRPLGSRPKSEENKERVLEMVARGVSYRAIAKEVGLSKNTVLAIVKRERDERREFQDVVDGIMRAGPKGIYANALGEEPRELSERMWR